MDRPSNTSKGPSTWDQTGKSSSNSYWHQWIPGKSLPATHKDNKEEVKEFTEMVKLLTKIVIKHEDELGRGRLERGSWSTPILEAGPQP